MVNEVKIIYTHTLVPEKMRGYLGGFSYSNPLRIMDYDRAIRALNITLLKKPTP